MGRHISILCTGRIRLSVVHTGKIVTRVLGTAFNIKAYAAEKSIEVTVDHGKVQVLKDGTNMGMLVGQAADAV